MPLHSIFNIPLGTIKLSHIGQNQQIGHPKIFMKSVSSSFSNDSKNGMHGVVESKTAHTDKNGKLVTQVQKQIISPKENLGT